MLVSFLQCAMSWRAIRRGLTCVCQSPAHQAHYIILAGRKPAFALSQRDGSILKPLPDGCGMTKPMLVQHLQVRSPIFQKAMTEH